MMLLDARGRTCDRLEESACAFPVRQDLINRRTSFMLVIGTCNYTLEVMLEKCYKLFQHNNVIKILFARTQAEPDHPKKQSITAPPIRFLHS